eukprot:UN34673
MYEEGEVWQSDLVNMILKLYEHLAEEGKVKGFNFIDLGANLGSFGVVLGRYFQMHNMGHKVYAVEGNLQTGMMLKMSVILNSLENIVRVCSPCAIVPPETKGHWLEFTDGIIDIWQPSGDKGTAFVNLESTNGKSLGVTVDQLYEEHKDIFRKAHFLKIDIQGAEYLAFTGAHQWLKYAPPCYVLTEIDRPFIEAFGTKYEDVFNLLYKYGYDKVFDGDDFITKIEEEIPQVPLGGAFDFYLYIARVQMNLFTWLANTIHTINL